MSKERLLQAKELIHQERYDDARKILKSIDHPTAREWLHRIDEITPKQIVGDQSKVGIGLGAKILIAILLIAVGSAIVFGVVSGIEQKRLSEERIRVYVRMLTYCINYYIVVLDYDEPPVDCSVWAGQTIGAYHEAINTCHRESPTLDNRFRQCLLDEGVVPIG